MNTDIRTEYTKLEEYIKRIKINFIDDILNVDEFTPSDKTIDNVKAFCILSHASIEEYFEKVAICRITKIKQLFRNTSFLEQEDLQDLGKCNQKVKNIVSSLILFIANTNYISDNPKELKKFQEKIIGSFPEELNSHDLDNKLTEVNSYTKKMLSESMKYFKDNIIKNNHGTSLKHLMKILIPVGIDIPKDLNLLNSLNRLADYRGDYAHLGVSAERIIAPSDITVHVNNCLKLCKEIRNIAII